MTPSYMKPINRNGRNWSWKQLNLDEPLKYGWDVLMLTWGGFSNHKCHGNTFFHIYTLLDVTYRVTWPVHPNWQGWLMIGRMSKQIFFVGWDTKTNKILSNLTGWDFQRNADYVLLTTIIVLRWNFWNLAIFLQRTAAESQLAMSKVPEFKNQPNMEARILFERRL